MFSWVGAKFDDILGAYVLDVVTALIAAITPLALAAMTAWVALYGWAVLRNEVPETLPTFVWKVFKIGLEPGVDHGGNEGIEHVGDRAGGDALVRKRPRVGFIREGTIAIEGDFIEEMGGGGDFVFGFLLVGHDCGP